MDNQVYTSPAGTQYTMRTLTETERSDYINAYNRGQHDAMYGNPYSVGLEQSTLEMEGYGDGFMSVPYNHG